MTATTHLLCPQIEVMSIAYPLGLNPIWTNFRARRQINYTPTLSELTIQRKTLGYYLIIYLYCFTNSHEWSIVHSSSQFKRISHIDMLLKLNFANRCSSIMTCLAEEMTKMPLEDDCKPQNIQHALPSLWIKPILFKRLFST